MHSSTRIVARSMRSRSGSPRAFARRPRTPRRRPIAARAHSGARSRPPAVDRGAPDALDD
ncbi:hypothetical protein WM16_01625 [Burkholderia ubonensis]|uniref:Uncharacterized protein n=1 Tax=Burkholderia ubonensis TaxID=101571 RepID=A0A108C566_9BURK|nr:hypothetical protein WM16_01625 [Burkholderia ubonensis]